MTVGAEAPGMSLFEKIVGRWVHLNLVYAALLLSASWMVAVPHCAVLAQALQPTPQATVPVLGQPSPPPASAVDPPKPASTSAKHAAVEAIPIASQALATKRKTDYAFKVTGGDWLDTGLVLNPGDHVEWSASGTLKIGDGREATADGVPRGWKDLLRQFPVSNANIGAVVARIGDDEAVPFAVGMKKDSELTPGGRVYLAVNLSKDLSGTGGFEVKIKLLAPATLAAAKRSETRVISRIATANDLESALSPTLFAAIPRRVEDQQGNPGDMVNFSLLGSEEQVLKAFEAAGWLQVDKSTQDAILHGLMATLEHKPYLEMPMSTLYLFGRPQDLSYARAAPLEVAAIRHHLRVWKTDQTVAGKMMWVGSATHDNGFEKDQRNGQITHHIDAKIDEERDFIQKSFAAAGVISEAAYVLPANALQTATTATGGSFESDGRVVVMELK